MIWGGGLIRGPAPLVLPGLSLVETAKTLAWGCQRPTSNAGKDAAAGVADLEIES